MKIKYGKSNGRPIKQSDNVIAARREVNINKKYESDTSRRIKLISFNQFQVQFWNKIDVNDDPEDLDKHIQFMKNELAKENIDLDNVKISWKKTLVQRRTFIQNHTTKEVLQEYPGYGNVLLVSTSLLSGWILINISFLLNSFYSFSI